MMIIILPGWQHSSSEWQAVHTELDARNIEHFILDLPGFGSEPYSSELNTIEAITNWTQTKLNELTNDKDYVLCGHSYGGRVATRIAVSAPQNLRGLVLIGSPNLYRPDMATKVKKAFVTLLKPLKQFIPERIKRSVRSEDYEAVKDSDLKALFQNIINDDQTMLLGKITIATKLLWGENDTAAPLAIATEIKELIPNATLEVLHGIGHNMHLEKPGLVAAKIATYEADFKNN